MVTAEGGDPMTISVLPYRDELKVGEGRLFIDGQWSESSEKEGGGYWPSQRSSQPSTSRYQSSEFLGFRIQWFSSGK